MIEPIEPRRQTAIIDVVHWVADAEFGVFPQGARAKEAVLAPKQPTDPCLVSGKRYLFKRSKRSYPDQFWGEIVAYRVGCRMGLEVPHAFGAMNSGTGHSAALIEWFYSGQDRFVHAGDYLQRFAPDFDRTKGTQHNLGDTRALLRAFAQAKLLHEDWRQWLVDMFVFDAVIGNTDRHQDNWGFIFYADEVTKTGACRLAPLFDNGTSLGHEMFTQRIAGWRDENINRYISRGYHHMGETRAIGSMSVAHAAMVEKLLNEWPETKQTAAERLNLLDAGLPEMFDDLLALGGPVPLTPERARFMRRLLSRRLNLLVAITQ